MGLGAGARARAGAEAKVSVSTSVRCAKERSVCRMRSDTSTLDAMLSSACLSLKSIGVPPTAACWIVRVALTAVPSSWPILSW